MIQRLWDEKNESSDSAGWLGWWPSRRSAKYTAIDDEEECSATSTATTSNDAERRPTYGQSMYLFAISRLFCFLMFSAGAIMLWLSRSTGPSDAQCTKQLSIWSPVFDNVKYEVRDFTGIPNKYVGSPTPELEDAWLRLENMPAVLVPTSRLPSLHRNVSQNFVQSDTPGRPGYIATIEVFHHLHCLNMIRQFVYRDSYPPNLVPALLKHNGPEAALEHIAHCFGTLKDALMCNADLTPYLWYEGKHGGPAVEDFRAAHKCKNWSSVVDAVMENKVDIPRSAHGKGAAHGHGASHGQGDSHGQF